jgi:chemotaxis protein methyltransferase WspC
MKCIENRLRATIGLEPASVGSGVVHRAVRHRMRSLGLKQPEDYLRVLEGSRAEWEELVESLVVTETWFFRDPEPIAAFTHLVLAGWMPARKAAPLRLLSVACSSGEEPFSLAMALLDAGVPADWFEIEAIDISARALAHARRGVYSQNSFRGKDLAFRTRYFQPSTEGCVLAPVVRHCVRFYAANFLDDAFLAGAASYDFIFCRNLLIYLDPLARRKALDKIERLLKPGGFLFVGPVEQPLAIEHGFMAADIPTAFACRKPARGTRRQRTHSSLVSAGAASGRQFPRQALARPPMGRRLPASSPSETSLSSRTDLETARRLADAGRLQEAVEVCEAHLCEHRASAQAYYLLGLVRDASGEPGAVDCYRKALYLDPHHYESLVQMALLLQNRGEAARARVFRNRALRVQPWV